MPHLLLSSEEGEWPWVAEESNAAFLHRSRLLYSISSLFKCSGENPSLARLGQAHPTEHVNSQCDLSLSS